MTPNGYRISAILVAILTLVAAGVSYASFSAPASSGCHLASTNPLIVDQPETPDSLDPAVTFSTPGWAAVQQVYQELVMYNGSSTTQFVGQIAKNWSTSSDGFHWNFTLWPNEHFSDGTPVNAYVLWYSLYRDLAMNQPSTFILSENFWFPGQSYYGPSGAENWNATLVNQLVSELNSWNFDQPSSAALTAMEAPNQSFRVLGPLSFQLNLGYGYLDSTPFTVSYHYVLPEISAPNSAAVDWKAVDAHGGVVVNSTNSWMSVNMVGSGPYELESYSQSSGLTLVPDPNYWGAGAAANETWNSAIQPAKSTIQTLFQGTTSIDIENLREQTAAAVSFAYVGPSTVSELQGVSCVSVVADPTVFGSTAGSWWIYMNQSVAPFDNLSVRAAVVHAINYGQIISDAFGGYARQWVGPVPPAYPDYNPTGLANYSYNLTLAKSEMAASPWPGGYPKTLNYEYLDLGDWSTVALLLKSDLSAIGININPVPISLPQLYVEQGYTANGQCVTNTTQAGGPFYIGQEFYTSDYIAPDDWTTNDAVSWGSANACEAGFANATVDAWIYDAAGSSNASQASQLYGNITQFLYQNYTDAWLVVPTSFSVYSDALHGVELNAMGSGVPYVNDYNTMYGT